MRTETLTLELAKAPVPFVLNVTKYFPAALSGTSSCALGGIDLSSSSWLSDIAEELITRFSGSFCITDNPCEVRYPSSDRWTAVGAMGTANLNSFGGVGFGGVGLTVSLLVWRKACCVGPVVFVSMINRGPTPVTYCFKVVARLTGPRQPKHLDLGDPLGCRGPERR